MIQIMKTQLLTHLFRKTGVQVCVHVHVDVCPCKISTYFQLSFFYHDMLWYSRASALE